MARNRRAKALPADERIAWYHQFFTEHLRVPTTAESMAALGCSPRTYERDMQAFRTSSDLPKNAIAAILMAGMRMMSDPETAKPGYMMGVLQAADRMLKLAPPDTSDIDRVAASAKGALCRASATDRADIRALLEANDVATTDD